MGTYQRKSSGNVCPQSSQLDLSLWTNPGFGVLHLENKQNARGEIFVETSLQIVACEENNNNNNNNDDDNNNNSNIAE